MTVSDAAGVAVSEGDLVVLDIGMTLGRIVKIDTPSIATGGIIDGKVQAQQPAPYVVIEILEQRPIIPQTGQILRVLKTAAQPAQEPKNLA